MNAPADDINELKEMFKRCVLLAEDAAKSAKIASEAARAVAMKSGGEEDFGLSMNDPFVSLPRPSIDVAAMNPFDVVDASNLFGGTGVEVKRRGRPPKTAN